MSVLRLLPRVRMRLSAQLAVTATLLVAVSSLVLSLFFVRQQSNQIREGLKARGLTLAKNAAYHAEYGILIGSREMLQNLLRGIAAEPDLAYAVIQDAHGTVLAAEGTAAGQAVVRGCATCAEALQAPEPEVRWHRLSSGVLVLDAAAPVRTATGEVPGLESSLLLEPTPSIPPQATKRIGTVRVGMSLQRADATIARVARATAALTTGVILAAVALVALLGRSVTRPLHALVSAAQRVAQGDLTLEIDQTRSDEIGQLARAFNQMVRSLHTLIKQMQDGIIQISGASTDIEGLAERQTAASVEQATSVAAISTSLEELAASAAGVAERSESVVATAEETVGAATGGQRAVGAALQGMDRIRDTVQHIAATAVRLGDRSQKIGDVLNIIQEIAAETHLLAVNAAIESAAAGEHGRRFSVVAGEVRRLAERSRTSAQEIGALVTEIQAAISASVMATEQGTKEVETGVELARAVERSLQEIVKMIEKTTQTAKEISFAIQQQRSASDQVVAAVREIADSAREAAEGMKQASSLAAKLTSLAAGFKEEASRFVLNERPHAGERAHHVETAN